LAPLSRVPGSEHPIFEGPEAVDLPDPDGKGYIPVTKRPMEGIEYIGQTIWPDQAIYGLEKILLGESTIPAKQKLENWALLSHGRFFLWGFGPSPSEMIEPYRSLFVNAIHYMVNRKYKPIFVWAEAEPAEVEPGEPFELVVRAQMQPGWHIYPLELPAGVSGMPTEITVKGMRKRKSAEWLEGWKPEGTWTEPGPIDSPSGPIHEGVAEFRLKLTAPEEEDPKAPNHWIGGEFMYMACTEEFCNDPDLLLFSAWVRVKKRYTK
jgi:hypothetical protein